MASVVCPKAVCLRTLASSSRVFTAATPAKAAFSTAVRPLKQLQQRTQPPHLSIICRIPPHRFAPTTVSVRYASSAPATGSPNPSSSSSVPADVLTWDRFFDLRRKRRYLNLVASLGMAVASVGVIGPVIAQQDIDTWGAQISGLDPMIVLGISTFAVAGLGWLGGPTIGNQLFSVWAGRRGWNELIRQKERSFYGRIKQYRADPASSSPQNPIPDYYGEKIASVKDYRRWLKDQRAFNLKKNKNMI